MRAEDILNNTDPQEIRNLLHRLKLRLDAFERPAPTELINTLPSAFPPLSAGEASGLGWFNVKDYGAIGDGAADDTNAVNLAIDALNTAGRGVLYFPAGHYLVSSALTTITADSLILGDGTGSFDESTYNSRVVYSSGSTTLFTVTALHAKFMHLELSCSASTPSAGSGIKVNGASYLQRVDYTSIRVYGFYIPIDVQVGSNWIMDNCIIQAPVSYGVKIQNTVNNEHGEWLIANCHFYAGLYDSDAAIRIESSGGGRIINSEINMNWGVDSHSFNHGIDLNSSVSGFLVISDCLIQNLRGHGIKAAGSFAYITVDAVQFGLSYYVANNTGNAININGPDGVIVCGCLFAGGTTPTAISLTGVAGVRILGCVNVTFSELVDSMASCSNIVIAEPGTAVAAETSYGLSSSVGSSVLFAKEDHTHGTPALSTATPQDVGSSGSAGSGSTPSKNDHVHRGVTSVNGEYGDVTVSSGELLMQDGVTSPPVPLETEDGSDWLYEG